MFDLGDLLLVFILTLPLIHWYQSQPIRDAALKAAQSHCDNLNLQLLDNCVYQRRLWFKRDRNGHLRLWRAYMFEFSATGQERYRGQVSTLGRQVLAVNLPPYRIDELH